MQTVQLNQRGVLTLPKTLRDSYGLEAGDILTLIDLGGVFVLSPQVSQIDVIADRLAEQWRDRGDTLESMMDSLRERRESEYA